MLNRLENWEKREQHRTFQHSPDNNSQSHSKCEMLVGEAVHNHNYTFNALTCCDPKNPYSASKECATMHNRMAAYSKEYYALHGYRQSPPPPSTSQFCQRVQTCNDQKANSNGPMGDGGS